MTQTCCPTGIGLYWFCFNNSVKRVPRERSYRLVYKKSENIQVYLLGGGIHIGTELGEGGDFTELGQIQLHGTRNLLHGLHLGGGTDTGDGQTDVDGWADTLQK